MSPKYCMPNILHWVYYCARVCYNSIIQSESDDMHPWRNRIAHQIPILTVGGSNPPGCTTKKHLI